MSTLTAIVGCRPLVSFFVASLALAWIGALPFLLLPQESWSRMPILVPCVAVVKYSPSLAALAVTAIAGGATAVRSLLSSLALSRAPRRWLVLALTAPLGLGLAAIACRSAFEASWPTPHPAAMASLGFFFLHARPRRRAG